MKRARNHPQKRKLSGGTIMKGMNIGPRKMRIEIAIIAHTTWPIVMAKMRMSTSMKVPDMARPPKNVNSAEPPVRSSAKRLRLAHSVANRVW